MAPNSVNQNPPQTKKKTIGIIQVTRIGDIIQTLSSCQAIREQYPHFKLILIAREQFAKPLHFLISKAFDDVVYISGPQILQKDFPNALEAIEDLVTDLNRFDFEMTINLSFSKTANIISTLTKAKFKFGPQYLFENKMLSIQDRWSMYTYANVLESNLNPFNLIDIYKLILGVEVRPQEPKKVLANQKTIVVHPFASSTKKRWPAHKWVEVIYKLLKQNQEHHIYVVGSSVEKSLGQTIEQNTLLKSFSHRFHYIVGETTIEDLYNLVNKAALFVGHDSMVSHLAAFSRTKTLTIALGPTRPHETTPYLDQVITLSPKTNCYPCRPTTQCETLHCHHDVSYQVVNTIASLLLTQKDPLSYDQVQKECAPFQLSSLSIYQSQTSELGHQRLVDLSHKEQSFADVLRSMYRLIWLYMLEEKPENTNLPRISEETYHKLKSSLKNIEYVYELSEFGKKYCRFIVEEVSQQSPRLEKIKEYSNKIDQVDLILEGINEQFPILSPIINFLKIEKGNTHGDNLVKLTESTFLCYHNASLICSSLYELTEKVMNNSQNRSSEKLQTIK